MNRKLLVSIKFFALLAIILFGIISIIASGGHKSKPIFIASIYSDQPADGDISYDPVQNSFTITNGPDTLFFGIDDLDPNFSEYRAFLDFPLDGSTGQDGIPLDAVIVSATLEIYINEVSFAARIPTLLDLVSYPINGLRVVDFNSDPLLSQSGNIFASDLGTIVSIDVTELMKEAQLLGLSDFQLRFLLDFISDVGFVGIDDIPAVSSTAPLLTVKYVL